MFSTSVIFIIVDFLEYYRFIVIYEYKVVYFEPVSTIYIICMSLELADRRSFRFKFLELKV